jgi:hypothetical protein
LKRVRSGLVAKSQCSLSEVVVESLPNM